MNLPQDEPNVVPSSDLLHQLQALTWIDHTTLGVMLVFFVMGLWKGLIWQVSRIAILLAAYAVAGRFGSQFAILLDTGPTPAVAGEMPPPGGTPPPGETTIYLAYVLLFLAVLVALSLLAMLLQKLAAKAGLGFFDRLGGGVLGVATGACVMLFGLFVVHMFFRGSQLAMAAEGSHSLRWSKRAIDWLGDKVPDDLRSVFALAPLQGPPPAGFGTVLEPLPGAGSPALGEVPLPPGEVAPLPGTPGEPSAPRSPVEIQGGNPAPARPKR